MAAAGARVVATDVDMAALEGLASDAIEDGHLDVCDANANAALWDSLDPPDVPFNCAGFVDNSTILQCNEAALERSFERNLTAMDPRSGPSCRP